MLMKQKEKAVVVACWQVYRFQRLVFNSSGSEIQTWHHHFALIKFNRMDYQYVNSQEIDI